MTCNDSELAYEVSEPPNLHLWLTASAHQLFCCCTRSEQQPALAIKKLKSKGDDQIVLTCNMPSKLNTPPQVCDLTALGDLSAHFSCKRLYDTLGSSESSMRDGGAHYRKTVWPWGVAMGSSIKTQSEWT
eukprot:6112831-Amphidinium_carterae.2